MTTDTKTAGLVGVILAAGKGVRAYPATRFIPKGLLEVAGRPLVERNIQIMRDKLHIRKIIVVVGYYGEMIIDYFKGKYNDIELIFVVQHVQKGIGDALLMAQDYIDSDRFVVILGDEVYIESDHEDLLSDKFADCDAILTFVREHNKVKISKNFIGNIQNNRVLSLTEKPETPQTTEMGVGTYLLNKKVFDYIRSTPPSALRDEVEITDVLSRMAQYETVYAHILSGIYINVNNTDDLNLANYIYREKHFKHYSVSVVIPAYDEQDTIAEVINDFNAHPLVNEILVVNNNSKDNTAERAAKAGARVVLETAQGYGCALKRGLDEAAGDIIILTEADGSFTAKDIPKFLEYLKDCDMVIGTRTTRQMIEQGANMGPVVRWINVIYGKLVEALWWNQEPRFTDVGCTYRAIWRRSYQKIRPFLRASGPEFAPEMMIAILLCRRRIIEIPVTYRQRFGGESKHSGYFPALARTALKMMQIILKNRFLPLK